MNDLKFTHYASFHETHLVFWPCVYSFGQPLIFQILKHYAQDLSVFDTKHVFQNMTSAWKNRSSTSPIINPQNLHAFGMRIGDDFRPPKTFILF